MSERNETQRESEEPMEEAADAVMAEESTPSVDDVIESIFQSMAKDLAWDQTSTDDVELECIEIEGRDYLVMAEGEVEGTTYLYLVNEDDREDVRIHKAVSIDGKEYVAMLESEEELERALEYFLQRYLWDRNSNPSENP